MESGRLSWVSKEELVSLTKAGKEWTTNTARANLEELGTLHIDKKLIS